MVNSANTECLLCGVLARGHFVPIRDGRDDTVNDRFPVTRKCAMFNGF